MTTAVQIYFSLDLSLYEIILVGIAWLSLLLALWPLMFLLRPRRCQKKLGSEINAPDGGWPGISVVVYCRDEASSLEQLLEKLFAQKYDGEFEIIIVSDGRNEDTGAVVKRQMAKFDKMRVTFVPDEAKNLSRRKMAFTLGIKAANHDIVLLTYADTIVNSNKWIASVASLFEPGKDVVIGAAIPKRLYGRGIPRMMRRLDLEMTTLTWMSAAIAGNAYRGEGHNLAFRKEVFFNHKGYSRTLNLHYGDDDLFVNEICDGDNATVNIRPEGLVKVDWHSPKHMMRDESARRLYTTRHLGRGPRALVSLLVWTTWTLVASVAVGGAMYHHNGSMIAALGLAFMAYWITVSLVLNRAAKFLRLRMPVLWLVPSLMLRPVLSLRRRVRMLMNRSTNFTWQKLQK